jgi:uncharacterized protein
MKRYFLGFIASFLLLVGASSAYAFSVPKSPNGFVNDYAHVLSSDQVSALETKLQSFEKDSSNEISVVIVPSLDGDTIENLAQTIFTTWGIGKKDKNNGALLLIAMSEHKTRIQTGYGLEGALTDAGTAHIQDEILKPAFQHGDYYGGIDKTVDALISLSKGEYSPGTSSSSNFPPILPILFIGFIILQWCAAIFARSKSWWLGGIVGGVFGILNLLINIFALSIFFNIIIGIALLIFGFGFDYFVSKSYKNVIARGGTHPWWGGGGGWGGGSSGGFGGFGGGASGGGGSSGGW